MADVRHEMSKQVAAAKSLLATCRDVIGDDEQCLVDMIGGETSLNEAIASAVDRLGELASFEDGLTAYAKKVKERAERFADQQDRIRSAISHAMAEVGLKKLEIAGATLSLRPSPGKVMITSEAEIPTQYFTEPAPKPDLRAIGHALKAGESVPGAMLLNQPDAVTIRRS